MLGVRWAELVPGREADLGRGLSEAPLQASQSVLSPISDFSKAPLAPHNPLFGLPYCSGALTSLKPSAAAASFCPSQPLNGTACDPRPLFSMYQAGGATVPVHSLKH